MWISRCVPLCSRPADVSEVMASHTRSKPTPSREALLCASVPASEKAMMSRPLWTSFAAISAFMRKPQVVVETAQPALRPRRAMSKNAGLSSGSPQPWRCTRADCRNRGQSREKVSMSMSRDCHRSLSVVWGQYVQRPGQREVTSTWMQSSSRLMPRTCTLMVSQNPGPRNDGWSVWLMNDSSRGKPQHPTQPCHERQRLDLPAHLDIGQIVLGAPFALEKADARVHREPQIHSRLPALAGLRQQLRQQQIGAARRRQFVTAKAEHVHGG